MTWFLDPQTALNQLPQQPLKTPTPTWGQQVGLSFKETQIANDSWAHHVTFENQLMNEMAQALGAKSRFDVKPATMDEWHQFRDHSGLTGYAVDEKNLLLTRMAELKQFDPGAVGNLPVTPEEFDAEVTKRRQAEYQDTTAALSAGHSSVAKMIGSFAGQAADETQIPFFFMGGGADSVFKFIATEAGLGGLGAALTLPKQEKVASDLGTPAPDAVTQIATGAALGAGFGAVVKGIGKGLSYVRTRNVAEGAASPDAASAFDAGSQATRAETALRTGEPPAPFRPNPTLEPQADPAVTNLTKLIGSIEAPRGFDQVYAGSLVKPDRPLTQMTIDQVLRWQDTNIAAGAKSSAAGRFQIIPGTLQQLKASMGLTGKELFTPELQRRMAIELMREHGLDAWRAGKMSDQEFGNQLASVWASLPDLSGPKAGMSNYAADGLNKNLISAEDFTAALAGHPVNDIKPTGGDGFTGKAAPAAAVQTDLPMQLGDQVVSPAGTRVPVRYEVANLPDLLPATGDLQPRDRSAPWSAEQIDQIARQLDAQRLMPSPEADRGAPIVGPDNIVESGNGRVQALKRAAQQYPDRFQAYQDAIRQRFQVPDTIDQPVLIARRTGDMSFDERLKWVRENNTSATARMASASQAKSDAGFLQPGVFSDYQPTARLTSPENAPFIRRVLDQFPQAERAAMYGADGRLNAEGLQRIRRALFARAFDAQDLSRLAAEAPSPALDGLLRTLEDVAPDWANFRSMVEAGIVRPEFDITGPLTDAARLVAKMRSEGRDGQSIIAALRDALSQGDLFKAEDPLIGDIIGIFYKGDRARSADAVREILQRYMADAAKLGRADMTDLLDGAVGARDVLRGAIDAFDRKAPFEPVAPRPETAQEPPLTAEAVSPASYDQGARSPAVARADAQIEERLTRKPAPEAKGKAKAADQPAPETTLPLDTEMALSTDENGPTTTVGEVLKDLQHDQTLLDTLDICKGKA